jgi:DNA-binding NtrC family response regulator
LCSQVFQYDKHPKNKQEKNKKIIVEDEQDILILYKDFLSRKGHEVATTFLNGEDIINEIKSNI